MHNRPWANVRDAGAEINEITHEIRPWRPSEVSTASREQNKGINQINQAVTQMDDLTQRTARVVEHAAIAASSVEQQASDLRAYVSKFRLAVATMS